MKERKINIDLEVIKKPKIYDICYVEASIYKSPLREPVTNLRKWQSLKNKIKIKILKKKI